MSTPVRRKVRFALLALACIGLWPLLNAAALPVTTALGAAEPAPTAQAGFGWAGLLDLVVRILALIIAWVTKPEPAPPDSDKPMLS